MEASDDVRDVDRVLAGDVDAFSGIVQRWQGPLVNLAFRFCRDRHQAEEMAHDGLIKVFRGLSRWRREGKFSTWMFAVSLNHYRSCLRRTGPPIVPLDLAPELPGPANVAEAAERERRDERVRCAVTALPEIYRDALTLYHLEELDVAEVAAILGVPEGTLKARLHRGRELLKRSLEQEPPRKREMSWITKTSTAL